MGGTVNHFPTKNALDCKILHIRCQNFSGCTHHQHSQVPRMLGPRHQFLLVSLVSIPVVPVLRNGHWCLLMFCGLVVLRVEWLVEKNACSFYGREIQPSPNWSTVRLRVYNSDWPWGPVTSTAVEPTTTNGPNPEPTGSPPPIFHFKHSSGRLWFTQLLLVV